MNIKPSHKFSVTELFRNDQRVTLSLTQLAVSASGQYRCEVIAEHPSFRTEWYRATMTVLREPLSAPVLVGVREVYEPSELIKIGCQPKRPFHGDHQPTLEWYLQGDQVGSKWVKSYGGGSLQDGGIPGLSLRLPGHQVEAAGGSMVAECRLTLGPHQLATNVTIKVRLRMVSYVDNYHASGSQKAEIHSGQPGVFLSNTLLASTVVLTSLLLTSSVLLTSIALLTSPAEALLTVLLL
ncbi:uncharacterized protein LOC121873221 [Homarus americanus]|uniref:uncharacterized protein LOC121873221 n=1 Tax=Homarus americanus TaxID=6706 RepID=UPI001C456339|nr:uncharacterized protein LOC121873221 [Homarus americanus]